MHVADDAALHELRPKGSHSKTYLGLEARSFDLRHGVSQFRWDAANSRIAPALAQVRLAHKSVIEPDFVIA